MELQSLSYYFIFLKMKKNKLLFGFTLLEMLVVIGIIAVLIGMISISYSTAQKKSRDAKRKGDLKTIQNAMEQYYSICGYQYPNSFNSGIICITPSVVILPTESVPKDPKTNSVYTCGNCDGTRYEICANLELAPTFCLKNQQ